MTQSVTAEIISIGTEILLGEITDTNSVHIARTLRDIGVNIYYIVSVGDNERRITDAIRIALSRADIVITTGGLGPTVDDMTRQSVAAATERRLTFHPELLEKIAQRFESFRVRMTDNNRQQAFLPDNAIAVDNPVGTAPAFIVEYQDKLVISLPGVPREMKFLLAEEIIPILRTRYNLGIIKTYVLRTAGIGESALDDLIGKELLQYSNPTVGLGAHSGVIDVRITAKAETVAEADRMIGETEMKLRERIGSYIFGTGTDTIEQALATALRTRQATIALSETGTGAPIAQLLKNAGAETSVIRSDSFDLPQHLFADQPELIELSLREQATSIVERLCAASGATVGIAVVSNPEQTVDHADSDIGTAVAVHVRGRTFSRVYGFGGQVDITRTWTGTWAMSNAWRILQESAGETTIP